MSTPITDALRGLGDGLADAVVSALAVAAADGPLTELEECPTCAGIGCPTCNSTGTAWLVVHIAPFRERPEPETPPGHSSGSESTS